MFQFQGIEMDFNKLHYNRIESIESTEALNIITFKWKMRRVVYYYININFPRRRKTAPTLYYSLRLIVISFSFYFLARVCWLSFFDWVSIELFQCIFLIKTFILFNYYFSEFQFSRWVLAQRPLIYYIAFYLISFYL